MDVFLKIIDESAKKFKAIPKKPVRIVANTDSDGITAASILIKSLKREGYNFSCTVVNRLTEKFLNQLKKEAYETIFFLDLGSSYLEKITSILKEKIIFILDHHLTKNIASQNILHINPNLFNLDGGKEISAAGIAYLFSKSLNPNSMDLAHLAIIGAIGDIQEDRGFKKLNLLILQDAVNSGLLSVKNGLKVYGISTKPLHKFLEYSTNPYIPGVTGSEANAVKFLDEIGIKIKKQDGNYKMITDLTEDEVKKILTSIILKRLGSEEDPTELIGPLYILTKENQYSQTRDAREFSTLINCCGRLNKPSLGIGACLNDKESKQRASELLDSYKREIIDALNWFHKNRGTKNITEENNFVLINAEDRIRDLIIGVLISTIAKSNLYNDGTIIFGLSHTLENETKVSARICGNVSKGTDLNEIIEKIIKKTGGSSGGHYLAAGAIIPQEKELLFIETAKEILGKLMVIENN